MSNFAPPKPQLHDSKDTKFQNQPASTDDDNAAASASASVHPPPNKKPRHEPAKEVDKLEMAFMSLVEGHNEEKNDPDRLYCLSLVPVM